MYRMQVDRNRDYIYILEEKVSEVGVKSIGVIKVGKESLFFDVIEDVLRIIDKYYKEKQDEENIFKLN